MVTIQDARRLLEQYFAEHPPALSGELYIAPEWFEDEHDYLPVWGAKEFLVDSLEPSARYDNLAIFVDKATGAVRQEYHTPNFEKIRRMSPIDAPAQ